MSFHLFDDFTTCLMPLLQLVALAKQSWKIFDRSLLFLISNLSCYHAFRCQHHYLKCKWSNLISFRVHHLSLSLLFALLIMNYYMLSRMLYCICIKGLSRSRRIGLQHEKWKLKFDWLWLEEQVLGLENDGWVGVIMEDNRADEETSLSINRSSWCVSRLYDIHWKEGENTMDGW